MAEIHTITLEKMAGYHLGISYPVPWALLSQFHRISLNVRKTTADLSPSFHPDSSLSIYLLGASWAFLVSVGAATWMSLSWIPRWRTRSWHKSRSHPNSAILLICILSIRTDSG